MGPQAPKTGGARYYCGCPTLSSRLCSLEVFGQFSDRVLSRSQTVVLPTPYSLAIRRTLHPSALRDCSRSWSICIRGRPPGFLIIVLGIDRETAPASKNTGLSWSDPVFRAVVWGPYRILSPCPRLPAHRGGCPSIPYALPPHGHIPIETVQAILFNQPSQSFLHMDKPEETYRQVGHIRMIRTISR